MMVSWLEKRKVWSMLPVVALLTGTRTIIDTGSRMIYPLLPVFARGVRVEVSAIVSIMTLMQLLGLVAPFIGRIAEQRGRKFTILLGLLLYVTGMVSVFILPDFTGLATALLLGALGRTALGPALQAYIGDRVPYHRRGLYLGFVELAWSGAFLFGVPAMTWLIASYNWQAPFLALAILGAVSFVVIWLRVERDAPAVHHVAFLPALRAATSSPMALAGLCLGFSISAANQLVSVVFGTWIEASFGIQLAALAVAAAVIGMSELAGEGIVTFFADRFGKRRLVLVGVSSNILACLILPLTGVNVNLALVGLFFFYLTFELSVVASIPLATELSPDARALYLTVLMTAGTLGRALLTPVAPALFASGLLANCLVAAGLNLVAIFVVRRYITVK
ncbi:MAG: MFS transporter [Anaerolineae bacterium]|nr:MFS transporter [Anaerolineae bacterium]NUQ04702.1 MFS transporter [Anaerolineae bacterium]